MCVLVRGIGSSEVQEICSLHFARVCPNKLTRLVVVAWRLHEIGDAPSGFLSHQCKLVVECKLNNAVACVDVSFFVKIIPHASPSQSDYISDFGAFKKEIRLYKSLIPRLSELSDIKFAPHCYLSKEFDTIVLEDISADGYRMANSTGGLLDEPHLLVTLELLATLHATSMIFEKQQNVRLNAMFRDDLQENAYPDGENITPRRKCWVSNSILAISALIAEIPEYSAKCAEIRPPFERLFLRMFEFARVSHRYRNAFGHGDLWKNNVMFKYATISNGQKKYTDVPVEAKFVDFQLARYAPPALDVMTICTMVTSRAFRAHHLRNALDTYYAHLSNVLNTHGLCVAVELPRHEFDASCDYYRLAGLIESCLFSHMVLLPKQVTQSIVGGAAFEEFLSKSRDSICVHGFRNDDVYNARMTDMIKGIVDEFILPYM